MNCNDVKPEMKVRVVKLGDARGMNVNSLHLACRRVGVIGTVKGVVPGHGGEVWWVEHDGGEMSAYVYDELELADAVMNYDPNLTNSGRTAQHTVRLTFGQWERRAERTVEVGGNCKGLSVIDCAVGNVYDGLPEISDGMGSKLPGIILVDPNDPEKQLSCTDDENRGDDWLKDMLIGAEIIAIRPSAGLRAEVPAGAQAGSGAATVGA